MHPCSQGKTRPGGTQIDNKGLSAYHTGLFAPHYFLSLCQPSQNRALV